EVLVAGDGDVITPQTARLGLLRQRGDVHGKGAEEEVVEVAAGAAVDGEDREDDQGVDPQQAETGAAQVPAEGVVPHHGASTGSRRATGYWRIPLLLPNSRQLEVFSPKGSHSIAQGRAAHPGIPRPVSFVFLPRRRCTRRGFV